MAKTSIDTSNLRRFIKRMERAADGITDITTELFAVNTYPKQMPNVRAGPRGKSRSGAVMYGPRARSFERMWHRRAKMRRAQARDPYSARTGDENARIYEEQAAAGRDPLFADNKERGVFVELLEIATKRFLEMTRPEFSVVEQAMGRIGRVFPEYIRDHAKSARSERGRMKPLTKKTKKYKRKYFYGTHLLRRTGQLLDSLRWRVRKSTWRKTL